LSKGVYLMVSRKERETDRERERERERERSLAGDKI
jgi:hypothetical protein